MIPLSSLSTRTDNHYTFPKYMLVSPTEKVEDASLPPFLLKKTWAGAHVLSLYEPDDILDDHGNGKT